MATRSHTHAHRHATEAERKDGGKKEGKNTRQKTRKASTNIDENANPAHPTPQQERELYRVSVAELRDSTKS